MTDKRNITERRIAKNALLLFVRMVVLMVINLIAVRFVRNGMGIEDYGIFNAIAGVVQVVLCLKNVLATASQRFLSIAFGRNDIQGMRDAFRISLYISVIISAVVLIFAETVGLWFVTTQMNYPASKFISVMVVYQFSILSFVSTMVQIPFLASVLAHEKMDVFSYVTIFEGILSFLLALAIYICPTNGMIVYACGLFFVSVVGLAIYSWYAYRRFPETKKVEISDKFLYKKMFAFSGWTLFGNLAASLMLQGNMILLNVFVGPVANAAFAIAITVYNAVNSLGNNIIVAFRPQMTMSYSKQDYHNLNRLFLISTCAIIAILAVVLTPLEIWMPEILKLWLGSADQMTIDFSRIMMLVSAVLLIGTPITIIILAVGCVKQYHLVVESVTLLCLPMGYAMLKMGYGPNAVCWSVLGCLAVAHIVRIERLYRFYFSKIGKHPNKRSQFIK